MSPSSLDSIAAERQEWTSALGHLRRSPAGLGPDAAPAPAPHAGDVSANAANLGTTQKRPWGTSPAGKLRAAGP